jgi:hypothetical protein
MATQHHATVGTEKALMAPSLLRNGARRRNQAGTGQLNESAVFYNQIRSYAHAEAQSWQPSRNGKSRGTSLEMTWKHAKETLENRWEILRKLATAGHVLQGEARTFVEERELIREGLQEVEGSIRETGRLPRVAGPGANDAPRAYAAAATYLRLVNYEFHEETFEQFFSAIQEDVPFEMAELWQLRPFTELALIELIAEESKRLDGRAQTAPSANLSEGKTESAPTEGGRVARLSSLLASLRSIKNSDWKRLFQRINVIETILRKDPCGAYAHMDFEGRELYCNTIAEMAERSEKTEQEVAQKALEFALQAKCSEADRASERKSHVGYYLLAEGRRTFEREIGYRRRIRERMQRFIKRWPDFSYILGIELATFALVVAAMLGAGISARSFAIIALFLLPAAECAVSLVNQAVTTLFPPKILPKLDFCEGIPAECSTVVAVPTLLTSDEQMRRAVRDLEIRFLANRDSNLHFALLTDPPDASQQFDEKDKLAEQCARLIQKLNEKYAHEKKGSFFLFHRQRAYNKSEGIWMGWERKRGKLLDFNNLLLGRNDTFPVKAGDLTLLPHIQYVITLDLDTQLPRDAARRLVGAMAHPLNRAVVDPVTNTVVEGYGVLQPRVDISIHSANRSRLASIFSADAGFDLYTRAVSDVYQDLFDEGSFTGKGIYEVKVFQEVLEHRFPCNAILSHDMIEGAYARAGLVSDIEVVDDYPSHMSAFSRRKHRWVRGDWQIVFWLLPKVPNFFGKMVPNPLSIISRWKILDNLRRSLTETATFVMLLCGWLLFPGKALYWTLATLAVVALPTFFQFALSIARAGRNLLTAGFWGNIAADFAAALASLFMRVAFLCHQSLVTVDAVVRAVVRMTVTHERLLEWETAAEAEAQSQKKSPVETYLDITPWISFFIGLFLVVDRPEAFMVALPLLVVWGVSKPIVQWLSQPARKGRLRLGAQDQSLLRQSALRTWRLFREYSTAEENWLIPDTVQEPVSLVVHRISTTNLGLLLNSRLSAMDLGFFTLPEFAADTEKTFDSIDRMPKQGGQMYNWYDTLTLEPVRPRFISSVDNGNLICSLWTMKQGCLEAIREPIFRVEMWRGVADHLETVEDLLASERLGHPASGLVKEMKEKIKALGTSTPNWAEALPALERDAVALEKKLSQEVQGESAWWAHELCLRITHLESLLYDSAPWMISQFAKYTQTREIQNILGSERVTLESLPRLCMVLDTKLAAMLEEDASQETQSALQLLRVALARTITIATNLAKKLARLAERADALAKNMDFAFFYDAKKKALSIGYEVEEQRLAPYFYDLLPSEARAATFVAIAKGEIPQQSWLSLERRYTRYEGERVLLSWTGTMFEYLMPMLWMKTFPNTLLDETSQAAVRAQRKFAESKSIPWGISEASCSKLSVDGHYHYQAFGVPGLAINEEKSLDLVVSPYSTFLGLLVDVGSSIENIRRMKELGWLGTYGFYEAGDFTPSRVKSPSKFEIVRCWLAHHQGMSLMAVANVLCNSSSQRRFHAEPMVAATERLLHEKAPRVVEVELASKAENSSEAASEGLSQEEWGAQAKLNAA